MAVFGQRFGDAVWLFSISVYTYETAAHRFTNLATDHLDVPVHFLKVHDSGVISKAYENDNVVFPTDALGSVEGQNCCRWWLYARCSRSRID